MRPFLILSLLLPIALCAQTTRTYFEDDQRPQRERFVDFTHLRLEVSFVPEKGLVKGKVTHYFTPIQQKVDSIVLDGPGIRILDLLLNGKKAEYKQNDQFITVYCKPVLFWETKDSLSIAYECNPRKGLYFIGWNDPLNLSRKQIWSQGQGTDNRMWIPMYDEMNDKITSELIVRFDSKYKVLSNGTKLGEKPGKDGITTWHYRMKNPHAPYLIMLGIGIYDIKTSKSKSGVPMYFYYYPEHKDRFETTYRFSEQMMDWLENETGFRYGWESYSQIPLQDYMYGAMENTTATVFGDFLMVDRRSYNDRYYVGVNAHELAHQWFGDLITARSSAHHWLQESFATYYNQMYEREVMGWDHFDIQRRNAQINSLEETKKNLLPIAHSEAGSTRHYPKGAFVLNMLKYVVGGKEAYNKCIKHYLNKHKYGNVDSHDLQIAFEEVLGYSLAWFWDEWVYRGGEPAYKVQFRQIPGASEFSITQTHAVSDVVGLFKMPIWFEVHYTDGTAERKKAWIQEKNHVVTLPNSSGKMVAYALFDPNNEIMKSVEFEKSPEMLLSQIVGAKYYLDRYDAAIALRSVPVEIKKAALLKAFYADKFNVIKGEVIFQLSSQNDAETIKMLKDALTGTDVQVKKHVVAHVRSFPADIITDLEKCLTDSSYEFIASTLELLCRLKPENIGAYLERTATIEGTVGRNVRVKWLEIAYGHTKNEQFLKDLVNYTSASYEFRTRVNAAETLRRLGHFDEQVMKNLFNALMSSNSRLAGPSIEVLKYFYQQNKWQDVIAAYIYKGEWEKWQREKIRIYFF